MRLTTALGIEDWIFGRWFSISLTAIGACDKNWEAMSGLSRLGIQGQVSKAMKGGAPCACESLLVCRSWTILLKHLQCDSSVLSCSNNVLSSRSVFPRRAAWTLWGVWLLAEAGQARAEFKALLTLWILSGRRGPGHWGSGASGLQTALGGDRSRGQQID